MGERLRRGTIATAALVAATHAWAASAATTDDNDHNDRNERRQDEGIVEVVVTVGTRVATRTVADSAVPVDVFSAEQVQSVSSSDLVEVLNAIVPSFGVRREPVSDGASFIRPTQLRGLESHHTLVLVDGKRRHRAALMRLGGFGSHGPDIGSIPAIAIDSVEVLRDGAAAQYGSDAIAGVMNFGLRTDASGFDLSTRLGGYAQGDGREATVEANLGLALGDAGFVNISLHASDAEPTSRSEPYDIGIGQSGMTPLAASRNRSTVDGVTYYGPDAFTYSYSSTGERLQVLPGSDGIPDDLDTRFADNFLGVGGDRDFPSPAQIWGQPAREQGIVVVNAAMPVSTAELYGFATYATKDQNGGFFYRRPGVSQLLPLRLADGSIYDPGTASTRPASHHSSPATSSTTPCTRASAGTGERLHIRLVGGPGRGRGPLPHREHHESLPGAPNTDKVPPRQSGERRDGRQCGRRLAMGDGSREPGQRRPRAGVPQETYRIEAGDPPSYQVGPFAGPDPFNFEITQAEVDADPDDELVAIECRIPGFEAVGSLCPAGDPVNNTVPIGSNGFPRLPTGLQFRTQATEPGRLHRHRGRADAPLARESRRSLRAFFGFR